MKVYWTNRAKARLKQIHKYRLPDSEKTANDVIRKLVSRSMQIGEYPLSGKEVAEYRRDDIRELLERPYRIIDVIKENQIDVISVIHYRQLLPGDLTIEPK